VNLVRTIIERDMQFYVFQVICVNECKSFFDFIFWCATVCMREQLQAINLLAKVSATPLNKAVPDWLDSLAASVQSMWLPSFFVLTQFVRLLEHIQCGEYHRC